MSLKLASPFFWFGTPTNGILRPWKYFKIDGVMPNAYDITRNATTLRKIVTQGIHSYLEFEGPIMMDSGGFLFINKKHITISPKDVLSLYKKSKPNFGVILDHPLTPNLSSQTKKRRQLKTLANTRIMTSDHNHINPLLIPVVHGFTSQSIRWYLNELDKIAKFPIYGIGSLVPSVFNTKKIGGIFNVIKTIFEVKKHLHTDAKVHVFGIGSTLTMHLMFSAGVDSVDSSSWRWKAVYGAIQLPGIGDRYITGKAGKKTNKKYLNVSRAEEHLLDKCQCPSCKRNALNDLKKSFNLRAVHNAWVFQKEVDKARKLIKNDEYDCYVNKILKNTRFKVNLDYIWKTR